MSVTRVHANMLPMCCSWLLLSWIAYADSTVPMPPKARFVFGNSGEPHNGHDTARSFTAELTATVLQNARLLLCLATILCSTLSLVFVYYTYYGRRHVDELLIRTHGLECLLLATQKDCERMLNNETKACNERINTCDGVIAELRKSLRNGQLEKQRLREIITGLEKDLVKSSDIGIQLQEHVLSLLAKEKSCELLLINVKDLQSQLKTQEQIMHIIQMYLIDKRKAHIDFQKVLSMQFNKILAELRTLEAKKDGRAQSRELLNILPPGGHQMAELIRELADAKDKYDLTQNQLQISLAKIKLLEDTIKALKIDSGDDALVFLDAANSKCLLLAQEKANADLEVRVNEQLTAKAEVEQKMFNVTEELQRTKLLVETLQEKNLEMEIGQNVLRDLFKDKETEMQRQLIDKELICSKQQDEIQALNTKAKQLLEDLETKDKVENHADWSQKRMPHPSFYWSPLELSSGTVSMRSFQCSTDEEPQRTDMPGRRCNRRRTRHRRHCRPSPPTMRNSSSMTDESDSDKHDFKSLSNSTINTP